LARGLQLSHHRAVACRSAVGGGEGARVKTLVRPRAAPGGSDRAPPDDGLVLGRYTLLEQIGSGGYGTVWVARDRQRRERVAVKRVPRHDDDPLERARIEREGRAAARLDHPAIVKLYETGDDAGAHYLVSELVEGSSLAKLYRGGGIGDRELLAIGSVLADALEHAHERGVVHRDVKPQNVIVPARPAAGGPPAKLTDFGIARLAGENPLTNTGDVIGTFEYMAPEQAQGRAAGPRADLYSLALTLYEGFAGANPLRGETVAATALRLGTAVEPLGRVRGDLPAALCSAIDRALTPAAASRGTLAQLRVALDAALEQGGPRRRRLRRQRVAPDPALTRRSRIALSARGRALLGAAAAGAVTAVTLNELLAVRSLQTTIFAGAGAAALVLASSAVGWLLVGLAALAWLGVSGDPGTALLVCAALAPVPLLLASRPWLWSAPALGPMLGVLGLAACSPVLAGRLGARAPARAALAALSYWWLAIAEALSGRRLAFGAPLGVVPRASWQGSLSAAFQHALVPLASSGRLATAALWALAAVLLPWLVRGSRRQLRAVGAVVWAGLLVAAGTVLAARLGLPRPGSPLEIGALAAVLAFATANVRALPHQSPTVA
jgi:tRNA A-37 threonylcarbamoyl transferase component Bud32